MIFYLLFTFSVFSPVYSQEGVPVPEAKLMHACSTMDMPSCKKLGLYYISVSAWEKALMVNEAICGRDDLEGCTYAGAALLGQNKVKEAIKFLDKACDGFEPYGCRSLGRLMKKAKEDSLARMYFKRACFYGLKEICTQLKVNKADLSGPARLLLMKIHEDCGDTQSNDCKTAIATVKNCSVSRSVDDCTLLAGHLSILFKAKLIQADAKLQLIKLHDSMKKIQQSSSNKNYTYDLQAILKDSAPENLSHYVLGFKHICVRKFQPKKTAYNNTLEAFVELYKPISTRAKANITAYFKNGNKKECKDPAFGYEVFALANLDYLDSSRLDIWKIDQSSNIEHVRDGLPLP